MAYQPFASKPTPCASKLTPSSMVAENPVKTKFKKSKKIEQSSKSINTTKKDKNHVIFALRNSKYVKKE